MTSQRRLRGIGTPLDVAVIEPTDPRVSPGGAWIRVTPGPWDGVVEEPGTGRGPWFMVTHFCRDGRLAVDLRGARADGRIVGLDLFEAVVP